MNILYILGVFIFTVSMLNLIRISVFSILSDWYDVERHRAARPAFRSKPFISVIVPAHNERIVLERCLLSIYGSTYSRFEVIIVDDGSTDTTAGYARFLRRKHGFKNLVVARIAVNGGKASAINYALKKHAKGSLVVAMDADCTIDPDALSRGVTYFRDRSVYAVASNVKVMNGTGILGTMQLLEYMLAYRLKKAHSVLEIEYLAGCTSFFRISAIKRAGYYDTDTIAEDFDFSLKLIRKTGGKIVYGEDVICYTEGVQSVKDLYKQRYRWRFGSFQAFYKNKDMFFNRQERLKKFLTFVLLPWLLFCEMLFLLEPLLLGSMLYFAIVYKTVLGIAYGFGLYAALVALTVLADEYIPRNQRWKLLMFSPVAYPLFMIVNYVGYASLLKSIVNGRGIINLHDDRGGGWVSPTRAATTTIK